MRAEACGTHAGSLPGSFPGLGPCGGCVSCWSGQAVVLRGHRAQGGRGVGWPPAQALNRSRMVKEKVLTSKRAPSSPVAKPGPVKTLTRKKNKKKKRFWRSKAQEESRKPGSGPGVVVRPPKAPEDFSQNWKALQEWLLKQKSQAPEKPLVISQMSSRKKPKIIQQNKKETSPQVNGEEMLAGKDPEASGGSVPSGSTMDRKALAPHTKAGRAEHSKKGTKERTNDNTGPERGDIKHKKRKAKEAAPAPPTEEDIWFDDVDPVDIEAAIGPEAAKIARKQLGQSSGSCSLVKEQAFSGYAGLGEQGLLRMLRCRGLTRALALDCEMVGVGPKGEESVAARVSIVNQYGKCVYDKYIKPTEPVTDYRTAVSGIRPENLKQGEVLEVVQKEVAEMLKGRVLVGHALHNDLKHRRDLSDSVQMPGSYGTSEISDSVQMPGRYGTAEILDSVEMPGHYGTTEISDSVEMPGHYGTAEISDSVLFLDHPKKKIRDTQKYKPFKSQVKCGRPSLRLLSEKILGIQIQQAEHCSIQDAQAAMRLYIMVKKEWESMARDKHPLLTTPGHCSDDA
ncbi:RNA exonuclease 4 [Plecturocebus cupreus]